MVGFVFIIAPLHNLETVAATTVFWNEWIEPNKLTSNNLFGGPNPYSNQVQQSAQEAASCVAACAHPDSATGGPRKGDKQLFNHGLH